MPEIRKLLDDILARRNDITEPELLGLINDKKSKVGGGYLTDQGALFLVASDLAITLDYSDTQKLELKDLFVGASDVTVIGRILSMYPLKVYDKKNNSKGKLRRLWLFDGDVRARVTLWDEKADLVESYSLVPDMAIRIKKGYVKAGLDGSPVLNVGNKGTIETLDEGEGGNLSRLSDVRLLPKDVTQVRKGLVIDCVVRSQPKYSEFHRSDGTTGSLTQFKIGDPKTNAETRVVIWDYKGKDLMQIPVNSKISLLNVKSKILPQGGVELHGDSGTNFKVIEVGRKINVDRGKEIRLTGKILTWGLPRTARSGVASIQALMISTEYKLFNLILLGKAAERAAFLKPESMIELTGRQIEELKVICDNELQIREAAELPSLGDVEISKIDQLDDETLPVFADVIALSSTSVTDVTTKDGEIVERAEVLVGDETGEIRVTAWREDIKLIEGIQPGQRLRLKGLQVGRRGDGVPSLTTKAYSTVVRES